MAITSDDLRRSAAALQHHIEEEKAAAVGDLMTRFRRKFRDKTQVATRKSSVSASMPKMPKLPGSSGVPKTRSTLTRVKR